MVKNFTMRILSVHKIKLKILFGKNYELLSTKRSRI